MLLTSVLKKSTYSGMLALIKIVLLIILRISRMSIIVYYDTDSQPLIIQETYWKWSPSEVIRIVVNLSHNFNILLSTLG